MREERYTYIQYALVIAIAHQSIRPGMPDDLNNFSGPYRMAGCEMSTTNIVPGFRPHAVDPVFFSSNREKEKENLNASSIKDSM